MTERQQLALQIIRDANNKICARAFAEKFWPDSAMHTQSSRGRHGNQRGKAAWLCAGSYMAKLAKRGWVFADRSQGATVYRITVGGTLALLEKKKGRSKNDKKE